MNSDYKKHYKTLIQNISDVLIKFIDELPDTKDDSDSQIKNHGKVKPVVYADVYTDLKKRNK